MNAARNIQRFMAVALITATGAALAVPSAGATVVAGSGFAVTQTTCALPGLVAYQGAGFHYVRFSTYVAGQGLTNGSWSPFVRSWNEFPSFSSAPTPPKGSSYAILVEYAEWNVVSRTWNIGSEWVMAERGYWCVA